MSETKFNAQAFAAFAQSVGANEVDKVFIQTENKQVIPVDAVAFMTTTVMDDGNIVRNIHIPAGDKQYSFPVDKNVPAFSKPGVRMTRPELKRVIAGDITVTTWQPTEAGKKWLAEHPEYNMKKANCYFELTDAALAEFARVQAAEKEIDEDFA
jgi:hypothetical protein